ncbi:MAG: MCE family protein [Pseudonocardiaceae bacterium]
MSTVRKMFRGRQAVVAMCASAALTLSGCGFTGIYDLPLPGGADLGDHPIQLKGQFRDVLDLVPQSAVKLNEVAVGRVEQIQLTDDGWNAEVTMLVNGGVNLPANALANIKQSSLLGEKYIELVRPPEGTAQGELDDGTVIPLSRTNRNVEVEELLGALSMLLNGGGVAQLNIITKELNNALEGNEPEIKSLLGNSEALVRNLDSQSADITRALDGLNRLSGTLNAQKDKIIGAIEPIGAGAEALEAQRGQLVRMLGALENLSAVAVDTLNQSQEDLVANLRALLPTLKKLEEAGSDLPKALEILLTFPFADSAVPMIKGDYANLYATINLNLEEIAKTFGRHRGNPFDGLPVLKELPIGEDQLIDPNALPLPESGVPSLPSGNPEQAPPTSGATGLFNLLTGGAG